jgi:cyanophycinase
MSGTLALVGGGAFRDGCSFDEELLAASVGGEVVVVPTAAAYEQPTELVERAEAHFTRLGARCRPLMVLTRPEAQDEANAEVARSASFLYLVGGSPMHLRSVLKDSPLWDAIVAAWHDGSVLAGSSAGAMVLCDPMVDPRGGAFTLGLALLAQVAVVPHHNHWSEDKAKRTIDLAPAGLPVVGIDEQTALIREPDGSWRSAGKGDVVVYRDGERAGFDALPG